MEKKRMKTIEVVAAIIRCSDKIFATQRGYGDFKDGWEFPGGKIEPGETAENALIREIKEELDTTIIVDKLIKTVDYDYPKFHLTMHCFLCSIESGNLELKEHEDSKWLDINTINSVDWLPADLAIIDDIREMLLKN